MATAVLLINELFPAPAGPVIYGKT